MDSNPWENALTAYSTFAQAIFTFLAVTGAVWIGNRQMKYMKIQNKISEEQKEISQEQTKIAKKQTEISKVQANISNNSFDLERKLFFLERVYSPILDDLMNINEKLNILQFSYNFPVCQYWSEHKKSIKVSIADIRKRIFLDQKNERLYKDCIASIETALNLVEMHQKKGTFFYRDADFQYYKKQYEPLYRAFEKKNEELIAIIAVLIEF
ncbi:MAG: hypothetical protein WCS30_13145 [Selenomonadaceae bacterium]